MAKEPAVVDAFMNELKRAAGQYPAYDQYLVELQGEFADMSTLEYRSRTVVDKLAMALQASVLIQKGEKDIAATYVGSRIAHNGSVNLGTLGTEVDCVAIIQRAQPQL
jgi:putative acyl-CoA dehydrogenase